MLPDTALVPTLHNIATRLRIESIRATTEAGSGHPTTCCSAADLVAALFFAEMRFDPRRPQDPDNDRFVLSKGHAAPLLYAAWAEAGAFDREKLVTLRQSGSDLEGHPTPRLPPSFSRTSGAASFRRTGTSGLKKARMRNRWRPWAGPCARAP